MRKCENGVVLRRGCFVFGCVGFVVWVFLCFCVLCFVRLVRVLCGCRAGLCGCCWVVWVLFGCVGGVCESQWWWVESEN
jgi:hypothetical protein